MHVRTVLIALGILIALGAGATFIQADSQNGVDSGSCIDITGSKKTACYQRSVESEDGFGAVELCGDCFACGYDDGVCPEDFTSDGVTANCTMCPDPDCLVTLEGYVYEEGGNPADDGINDVTITAELPHTDTPFTTTTDYNSDDGQNGYYSFQVPRGDYEFSFQKDPYATQYAEFPLEGSEPYEKDVELNYPSCNADPTCTMDTALGPRCDASCDGKKGCDYPSGTYTGGDYGDIVYDLAVNCSGKSPSRNIFLGLINETHQLRGTCCDGAVQAVFRPKAKVDTNVTNIVVEEDGGPLINDRGEVEEPYVKVKYYFYKKD